MGTWMAMTRCWWRSSAALIAVAVGLSACGGEVPPLATAPAMPSGYKTTSASDLPPPQSEWWREFHSDELNDLIAAALISNHDLRIAIARVEQAEAQSRAAGAGQMPALDFIGKTSVNGPSGGTGTAVNGVPYSTQKMETTGLRLSYEFDLWGRAANTTQSAYELAKASVYAREAVGLSLTGDVAKTYVDYLAFSERVAVATRNLDDTQKTLDAVRTHMERGGATVIEKQQQETAVAVARGVLAQQSLARDKARNRLASLLGMTPSELSLHGDNLSALSTPSFNAGIPSQLICRRPDIRKAEATLRSAHADIKAARAKLYPDLSFSLEMGRGAYSFAALASNASRYLNLLGEVTQSIFDAGKGAEAVNVTRGRYREMVEVYFQSIHEAVHDVEDSLAEMRWTDEQMSAAGAASASARKARDLTGLAYERGVADYMTMLETERSLNASLDAEVANRSDRVKASIDLYKALGGGFSDTATGCASEAPLAAPVSAAQVAPAPANIQAPVAQTAPTPASLIESNLADFHAGQYGSTQKSDGAVSRDFHVGQYGTHD